METTSKTTSTRSAGQSSIDRKQSSSGEFDDIQKAWNDASGAVEKLFNQASATLQQQVQERPYVALAAAAGLGFVLGGGLSSATGRFLLRTTAQLVVPGVLAAIRVDED